MDVCGYLRPLTIGDNHVENGTIPPTFDSRRGLRLNDGVRAVTGSTFADNGFSYSLDLGAEHKIVEGYFLFMDVRVPDSNSWGRISGLLLEITETANTYRRFGTHSDRGSDTVTMRYRSKEHTGNQNEARRALKDALKPNWSKHDEKEGSKPEPSEEVKSEIEAVTKEATDPAAFYADDHGYEDYRFERLTAQTVRLI